MSKTFDSSPSLVVEKNGVQECKHKLFKNFKILIRNLIQRILRNSVNFRLDREFFEVRSFDPACVLFVNNTHAYPLIFCSRLNFAFALRTRGFFVIRDKKYQTCLIFGLSVTSDKNTVKIPRTLGNFVDPTCYE